MPAKIEIKLPADAKLTPTAQARLDAFTAIMSDPKTTPTEKAQAIIDAQFKAAADFEADQKKQFEKFRADDLAALKADKDFGGDKLEATRKAAISAATQFGGKELSDLFTQMGIDQHPAVVKTFARIRQAIAEDHTPNIPPGGNSEPITLAKTLTERMADRYRK